MKIELQHAKGRFVLDSLAWMVVTLVRCRLLRAVWIPARRWRFSSVENTQPVGPTRRGGYRHRPLPAPISATLGPGRQSSSAAGASTSGSDLARQDQAATPKQMTSTRAIATIIKLLFMVVLKRCYAPEDPFIRLLR